MYIIALCSSINTTTFFSLDVRCCPVPDLIQYSPYPNHSDRQKAAMTADRLARKTKGEGVAKNTLDVMISQYRKYYESALKLEGVAPEFFQSMKTLLLTAHVNQVLQNYHGTIKAWHKTFHTPLEEMSTDVSPPLTPDKSCMIANDE
jgi:hypothetical protein